MFEFKFDFCYLMRIIWVNSFLVFDVKRVIIFVVNNYVKIMNDKGFEVKDCNRCIFVFSG